MEFMIKFLIVLLIVLCITSSIHVIAYYATSYQEQMEVRNITSEGPECKTIRWYIMDAVGRFDDILCKFCKAVGNDRLLIVWRSWLKEQYGVTMY